MQRNYPSGVLIVLGAFFIAAAACARPQPEALADLPRIGMTETRPRTPGAFRLASYNVENLFDDKDDPTLTGEFDDMRSVKPEAELRALADTIRRIDADIIAMQEVESFDALMWFIEGHLQGEGYDHVVSIDAGDARGIEQSVISRFPLKNPRVWRGLPLEGDGHPEFFPDGGSNREFGRPFDLRRSPLRVTAEIPGEDGEGTLDLTLFIVHHKSGRGYGYWREAEARAVVGLVREFLASEPDALVAVLGDFNAQPHEEPLRVYLDAGLIDVFADRPAGDSRFFTHASERVIDFILVTPPLAARLVPESRFILATPQLRREEDWRTAPRPEGYASDHLPLVADFLRADP